MESNNYNSVVGFVDYVGNFVAVVADVVDADVVDADVDVVAVHYH